MREGCRRHYCGVGGGVTRGKLGKVVYRVIRREVPVTLFEGTVLQRSTRHQLFGSASTAAASGKFRLGNGVTKNGHSSYSNALYVHCQRADARKIHTV
jgi:hypothetical protein